MRFLLSPVYMNLSKLNSSSTYAHCVNLVSALLDRGHFVYWHLPLDIPYTANELENHERVKVIRTPMLVDQYIEASQMRGLDVLFDRNLGTYPTVDAILTSRTPTIPLWKQIIETPSVKAVKDPSGKGGRLWAGHSVKVPFFVIDFFPKKMSMSTQINPLEYQTQSYGYAASDRVFVGGISDFDDLLADQRRFQPASEIRKIMDGKFQIKPFGINVKKVTDYAQRLGRTAPDPKEQMNLIVLGRILSTNHALKIIEQADYLHRRGGNTDLKIPTSADRGSLPGPMNDAIKTTIEHAPIQWSTPQSKFFEYLLNAHVGINMAADHNFPTAILEAIVAGVPVVSKPEKWLTYYLGKDYPFYYDGSHSQLLAVLEAVKQDWKGAQERLRPYSQRVSELYDSWRCMNAIVSEIEEVARQNFVASASNTGLREIIRSIPADMNNIRFDDMVQYVEKNSRSGIRIGKVMTTGWMKTRAILDAAAKQEGWVDTCQEETPVYVRGGVVAPMSKGDEDND